MTVASLFSDLPCPDPPAPAGTKALRPPSLPMAVEGRQRAIAGPDDVPEARLHAARRARKRLEPDLHALHLQRWGTSPCLPD